ncbi:CCGSCS motif protein [Vibrio lamellibrachiae]|uniref:CCGSCS motif protein n=1 Tax=Vibrio lamellibrachiae TaxID=2910253 RepID=UPI003D0F4279
MTFSIKKIFSGKDEEAKAVQTQEASAENRSVEETKEEKKTKHDSPTGCCGSCS